MRRRLKLNREHTIRGRFEGPQYVAPRASKLRGDLGDTNKLVHDRTGDTLVGIVYIKKSTQRHVNIGDCPCRELQKNVCGAGGG